MTASDSDLGLNVDVLVVASPQMELSAACEPAKWMRFDLGAQCSGCIMFWSLPCRVGVIMSDTEAKDNSSAIIVMSRIPSLCKSGHMTHESQPSGAYPCTQDTNYFSGPQ